MDNTSLFFLIHNLNHRSPVLDNLMLFGATNLIFITALLMFVLNFTGHKEKKALILAILAIPVGLILIEIIHLFVYEPRPFVTYHFLPSTYNIVDASFPSHHATIAAVIAFSYIYFKSKWSALFLIIATWIGFSRIYAGVHYPVDIFGGFIVALISIYMTIQLKSLILRFFR